MHRAPGRRRSAAPAAQVVMAALAAMGVLILGACSGDAEVGSGVDLTDRQEALADESAPAEVATVCDEAMGDAAAVGLSQTNDAEVAITLTACTTYDEWEEALRAKPDVLGLTSITSSDVSIVLQVACARAMSAAVCVDAEAQGLLP